jgi:hypothetical protein
MSPMLKRFDSDQMVAVLLLAAAILLIILFRSV